MRAPGGYGVIFDPQVSTPTQERDTFTCGHCQAVVFVTPQCDGADAGGLCKQCMRLICPRCVDRMVCVPWEKMLEMQEAKGRTFRSVEDTLGRHLGDRALV